MEQFIIAGLKTEFTVRENLLRERSEKYRAEFDESETDIKIDLTEEMSSDRLYLNFETFEDAEDYPDSCSSQVCRGRPW